MRLSSSKGLSNKLSGIVAEGCHFAAVPQPACKNRALLLLLLPMRLLNFSAGSAPYPSLNRALLHWWPLQHSACNVHRALLPRRLPSISDQRAHRAGGPLLAAPAQALRRRSDMLPVRLLNSA